MDTDVTIVGQGLAGATLAWRLAERGVSIRVLDAGGPNASRVAAGLITPVTGKRMTVAADYDRLWSAAQRFYRSVESATGASLLHELPAARLFQSPAEAEAFKARAAAGQLGNHVAPLETADTPAGFDAEFGGFAMPTAARLRVADYLDATRSHLAKRGAYERTKVEDPTRLLDSSRLVVLCQGHTPAPVRWLEGVAFAPAKGEVLTIDTPALRTDRVVHRGVWIAPCESGVAGRYRVGSTTEWNQIDSTPTIAAREELTARLRAAWLSDFRVVDQQAAVRPATPERRPTYGFSRAGPRIGWLNGLGAKGSLWAPFYADRMADLVAQKLRS